MERPEIPGETNRQTLQGLNRALHQFARRLEPPQDKDTIAGLLCQAVHDAMGWQQATVWLVDRETGTWHSVAQIGHSPEILDQQGPWLPAPPGAAAWQREEFRVSHSYYVPDVSAVSGLDLGALVATAPERARDLLIVLLEAGQEILGMLVLAHREGGQAPAQQQIEYLELLAVQAAMAFEHARLSRSLQMWADAVRYSGDAIFLVDVAGTILDANPAFEALTGYNPAAASPRPILTLQSCLSPPELCEEMRATVQDGCIWRGEVTALRMDGSAYDADMTLAPIVGATGEIIGLVGSQRDITPVKELDRHKSEFVSRVSHDLRTPLTNIKLYQRYLREDRRPNMRERFYDILEVETSRLERIVESLLDLLRLETGMRHSQSETVHLNDLARAVLAECEPTARTRGISLVFEPCSNLPGVMADRQQMAAILASLLAHALSYTPDGGRVEVMTERGPDSVLLTVKDNGSGIAPEEMDRVFERFDRGEPAGSPSIPGAGLGLPIVKQILELHRGTLEIDSLVGKGTTLTVSLPSAGRSSDAPPDSRRS